MSEVCWFIPCDAVQTQYMLRWRTTVGTNCWSWHILA